MNFWKSLWPSNPPAYIRGKEPIAVLRERTLQTILLSALTLGSLFYVFLIRYSLQTGSTNNIFQFSGALVTLFILTLTRTKFAYKSRTFGLLALQFLIGSYFLLQSGSTGSGFLFLIVFVTATAILLGPLAGSGAVILSFLVTFLISYGVESGYFIQTTDLINSNTTQRWASVFIFLLAASMIFTTISIIIVGLQRDLHHSVELASDLQEQRNVLSNALQEKTSSLERRITEIRTATEIIRSFSSVLSTETLMQTVVDLIHDRLDLYYVGLFLVDAGGQSAVLKAGTGDAGRIMLASQHRLPIGGVSMIGWSIANLKPRIALDIKQEGMHFNNPNLPETRSELALPIIGRGDALGALTIQSTLENAFDENDITILQGIADSLGIALENARLFEQSQKDLAEISSLNRQYVQQSWSDEIMASGNLSYVYENHGVRDTGSISHNLQIPIRLRNQVIGQIEIEKDTDEFSGDDIELVESISSQTAVALESARLLQESQRKASQEEKIVELTSRFSQALGIDDILQTAVKELGQLPSISEISIQLAGQNKRNEQYLETGSPQEGGK